MDKIHWGILGCAPIARRAFIPAVRESRNGLPYGIASRDPAKAAAWADEFGFERAYRDYAELVEDPAVDAVYIPLPNHLHAPWAVRAARAGKHVLCEKPMALDAAEAAAMIREAARAGTLLMEGFMYRFHPQVRKLRGLLDAGEVGRAHTVRSTFGFLYAGDPRNYRWSAKMGGGSVYDVGCYPVSAARLVFADEPVAVCAKATFHPRRKVDMSAHMLLEFPGGRFAHLDCSFESDFESRLEVSGPEGRIVSERFYSAKRFPTDMALFKDGAPRRFAFRPFDQFRAMAEHFGDAVLKGVPLRFPPRDARLNMRVLDAVFASIRTGRTVRLPAPDGRGARPAREGRR